MKTAKITEKNDKELEALITDTRAKVASLVIDLRTKKVTNVKELHEVKRTLARALTVQRQRALTQLEEANA